MEICFELTPCDETGGYVARWDDPAGGGICTQGDSFAELDHMIRDVVDGYFADKHKPESRMKDTESTSPSFCFKCVPEVG
jgi:predicted RNase H-like HicB family nuclease